MMYSAILVEHIEETGVVILTLNRPKKRNAMNPAMHEEMTQALEELRYNDSCRVVVVTGAGKAFCAGMDLKEFFTDLADQPAEYDRISRLATEWRGRTLRYYPKPTIAMVNGYCFGGAFSIVEGCDLAVAAEDAIFGLSEINFGLFPGGTVGKSLAYLLRPRDALYYALTGRTFDGNEAAEMGFVNEAVPASRLHREVIQLATEIADHDPAALEATKNVYRHSLEMNWEGAMNYASALAKALTLTQKNMWREEGIRDFLAKSYRPGLERHQSAQTEESSGAE